MFRRVRVYMAAVAAFLLGVPFTESAFGQSSSIVDASVNLADAIINASAGES